MGEEPRGRGKAVLEVGRGGEKHVPFTRKISACARRNVSGTEMFCLTGRKMRRLVPGPEHGDSEEEEDGVFEP